MCGQLPRSAPRARGVRNPRLTGRLSRPWFESALAPALASMPEINAVLRRPDARIADIGYGAGWSTIALARAYPSAAEVGIDVDEPSIQAAKANAEAARVADRVISPWQRRGLGRACAVRCCFAFECTHDVPRPVEVLAAIRDAVRSDGVVIMMRPQRIKATANSGGQHQR
jgi:tRNA A58 N-methylase Trm61